MTDRQIFANRNGIGLGHGQPQPAFGNGHDGGLEPGDNTRQ